MEQPSRIAQRITPLALLCPPTRPHILIRALNTALLISLQASINLGLCCLWWATPTWIQL